MKLQVVPAGTGVTWVRQGIRTFWRQPLALSGLFFLFTGLMMITSFLSFLGTVLGLMLIPSITLGLMAAAREVEMGRFPMPRIMFVAFRQGAAQTKVMVAMGGLYALLFGLLLAVSSVFDSGDFARMYLMGGTLSEDVLLNDHFQTAAVFCMLMYVPLSAAVRADSFESWTIRWM